MPAVKMISCCSSAERRRVSPNRAPSAHWQENSELGVAVCHRLNHLCRPRLRPRLGLHRVADSKTLEQPQNLTRHLQVWSRRIALSATFASALRANQCRASERPSELQHRDQRAMSVVGPATSCDCAAASLNNSRGTTARSNGSPLVANLISSGVVPKRKTSLWPEALSNCAPSSFSGAVMPPPVKTWSSAACRLAFGEIVRYMPSIAAVAVSEDFSSYPFFPVALGNKQAKLA